MIDNFLWNTCVLSMYMRVCIYIYATVYVYNLHITLHSQQYDEYF